MLNAKIPLSTHSHQNHLPLSYVSPSLMQSRDLERPPCPLPENIKNQLQAGVRKSCAAKEQYRAIASVHVVRAKERNMRLCAYKMPPVEIWERYAAIETMNSVS